MQEDYLTSKRDALLKEKEQIEQVLKDGKDRLKILKIELKEVEKEISRRQKWEAENGNTQAQNRT